MNGELSDKSCDKHASYISSYVYIIVACLNALEGTQTPAIDMNRIIYELFTTVYNEPSSESKMVCDIARETLGYVQNIRIKCDAVSYLIALLDNDRLITGTGDRVISRHDSCLIFSDLYEMTKC